MPDAITANIGLLGLTVASIGMTIQVALSLWGLAPDLPSGSISQTAAVLTVTGLAYLWL